MNKVKLLVWLLVVGVLAFFLGWVAGSRALVAKEAEATFTPKVDVCHCATADNQVQNCQTLNIAIPAAIAHLAQHENDHAGACSQDVCSNIDGIQEETPQGYENSDGYCFVPEDPELCEDEAALNYRDEGVCEYEEEPPVEEQPVTTSESSGPPAPQVCEGRDLGGWSPTIDKVGRIDSDTVFAHWTSSTSNADDYILWYGLSEDNQPWNVKVENSQYAEVSGSQLTGHVWFRVQATDNCVLGPVSQPIDP